MHTLAMVVVLIVIQAVIVVRAYSMGFYEARRSERRNLLPIIEKVNDTLYGLNEMLYSLVKMNKFRSGQCPYCKVKHTENHPEHCSIMRIRELTEKTWNTLNTQY